MQLLFPPPRRLPSLIPPHSSPTSPPPSSTAIIVGAGLAGLTAATHLASSSLPFLLLDSSDAVGGRVRTDRHDGFLLDRGFQIFLSSYPELRRHLDYPSLNLQPFYPGALVFHSGQFHRLADPFRRPLAALSSLANPIGSPLDKLLIGLTRTATAFRSDDDILSAPETSISDRLKAAGFSPSIIERFLRPFFAGIFFDTELETTSRLFDFVFKCLALGDNSLPANGIGAVSEQLAARLPQSSILLNTKVTAVSSSGHDVTLSTGDVISADLGVIVAVDQPEFNRLLPQLAKKPGPVRSTVCIYFTADRASVQEPILILNGSGRGIVNNMFFATNVAPSYGPKGKTLVSVSLVGQFSNRSDEDLVSDVIRELKEWFGSEVEEWRHLRTYRVGFAQPDQRPPTKLIGRDAKVGERLYVCGDHWASATFDGAMASGRRAAQALLKNQGLGLV